MPAASHLTRRGALASRWVTPVEQDFTLGIIRDAPRTGIPPGGVYDALNFFVHRPGVAFKRGGIQHPMLPVLDGDHLICVSHAIFPTTGERIVVVSNTFDVNVLTDQGHGGLRLDYGEISGFTDIVDPPTLFVGGSQNVLVFCDSTGKKIPWFFNGGDAVQQFQGGNAGASGDYDLTITGSPTGGQFGLAIQDVVNGLSYDTLDGTPLGYNASSGQVNTALELAAPALFPCTGGPLPDTPVTITVPAGWAVSYIPSSVSGLSLTGGTNVTAGIGPVDGTATGVPTGRHSTVHLQRLILASSFANPNRLWFGPLLNPTGAAWDTANSWIDMDQAVTALASLSNVLLVFSNETMWRITGDSPPPDSNMTVEPIGHVGCTDARSVVTIEGRCIFANPRGVYITTGVGYESLMKDRLESYWQDLFGGYDPATWTISCGLFGRRFLFVSVLTQDDELQTGLVCDIDRRAWVRVNRPVAKMYAGTSGSRELLYAASTDTEFLEEVSDYFTPRADANEDNVFGPFDCLLETRPLAYSPALKAFGDAHLSYDLRSE